MNALPILYSFRRCPYAMRARMALLISGTACELREIRLRDKPAAMLTLSPKGTVPVLLTPPGQVIDQSIDIMHWALAVNDPENWLATVADPLVAANDGPFKTHLDRYKYQQSEPDRDAATAMLAVLEERLPFSETRSFADVAIFPFIRQFANTDRSYFESLPLPKIQHWLTAHIASPLFETAMLNHPIWCERDAVPTYLTNAA